MADDTAAAGTLGGAPVRQYAFNYFGVSGNFASLMLFAHEVKQYWLKWLRRRSNRHSLTSAKFTALLERYPLPRPRIMVRIWGS